MTYFDIFMFFQKLLDDNKLFCCERNLEISPFRPWRITNILRKSCTCIHSTYNKYNNRWGTENNLSFDTAKIVVSYIEVRSAVRTLHSRCKNETITIAKIQKILVLKITTTTTKSNRNLKQKQSKSETKAINKYLQ